MSFIVGSTAAKSIDEEKWEMSYMEPYLYSRWS
jgi:hypothetical protein